MTILNELKEVLNRRKSGERGMFNREEDCKKKGSEEEGKDSPGGRYYNVCPCDPTKCPDGYDSTFPNNLENLNPIDDSISANNLLNKSCGDIAGIVPSETYWKQDVFDKCIKLYNLQDTIKKNEKNMTPINNIYKHANNKTDTENFTDTPNNDSPMSNNYNEIKNRITSFNGQLKDRVQKDYSFLKGQVSSIGEIQSINNKWNDVIDDMHEMDSQVTNEIQVKARLTELNNDASRQKSNTIMLILNAFLTLFIFVFSWVGYLSGNLSLKSMFIYFFFGILTFIIIALSINKYTLKEFKKISNNIGNGILKAGDKLNISALEWVDDNCDCSKDTNDNNKQINTKYNKNMEHQKYDEDSIYYDNGTLKYRITPSDFARETGHLPSDIKDGDDINNNDIIKVKKDLNMVKNKFNEINSFL